MHRVLESYRRFDQKNNMVCRPYWDPSLHYLSTLGLHGDEAHDSALVMGAQSVAFSFGGDVNEPNVGLTSWEPSETSAFFKQPSQQRDIPDLAILTRRVKRVARYFGADLVGVANLDLRWVYSHYYLRQTGTSKPVEIDSSYKYVICMALEMEYRMIRAAPSALSTAEVMKSYSRMASLVNSLAVFIRRLGYRAIPSLNDTALNVPIAIDAGLGELGRHGLLISPEYGPRQRLCKVITDLPLTADRPLEFGVPRFCSVCHKCARNCPAGAISCGEPTAEPRDISNNGAVLKWPVAARKCREYWNKIGSNCGICVRVCPFNKDAASLHAVPRWLVKHAPRANSLLVWLDERFGCDNRLAPEVFWDT